MKIEYKSTFAKKEMRNIMNWSIIGTGSISKSFIKALRNNNETPLGIWSRTLKNGKAFATKNNIQKVITSLEDLEDYDAVYIATPNTIHYEQAKQAIIQKKNVLIEKPMTHSYAKTQELFSLAEKNQVKIMEAYPHITHDEYKHLSGRFLQTNYMRRSSAIKDNTYKTKSEFKEEMFGGVVPDIGVYPISGAVMMLGKALKHEIVIHEILNDVIVDCDIKLIHEKGISAFRTSKLVDGDNALYLDFEKVLKHLTFSKTSTRMDYEVNKFVNNIELDLFKNVSLETARVLELLLK